MQGYGCGCVIWDSRKKQKEIKTIMRKMRLFPLLMAAAIAMSAASGCSAGNGGGTAQETGTKAASLPSSEAGTEDAGGDGAGGMDKAGKADEPEGADKAGKADEPEGADKSGEEVYSKIPDPVAEDGSKILFVGNSHTYTNDLPGVFYQMAEAGGQSAHFPLREGRTGHGYILHFRQSDR